MATIASPTCPQCDEELIREKTDLWRCLYCGLPVNIDESGIARAGKAPVIADAAAETHGIYDAQPYVSEVVTESLDAASGPPAPIAPAAHPQRSKRR